MKKAFEKYNSSSNNSNDSNNSRLSLTVKSVKSSDITQNVKSKNISAGGYFSSCH